MVESGAGVDSAFSDDMYREAGAEVVDSNGALGADLVLKVRPPTLDEVVFCCSFVFCVVLFSRTNFKK